MAAALSVTASNVTTPATYTWIIDGYQAAPTTTSTYTTPVLTTTTANLTYTVQITNDTGCMSAVATGTITVNAVPTVTTTSPDIICYNTAAALSCTVSGGTTTAMTYTWKIGTATTTTTAPSATSASLTAATTYNVTVTNANGCASTVSNTGNIPVYLEFSAGSITTASGTTTRGTNPNVIVANASSATGGDGSIAYQWRRSGSSAATLTGSDATYQLDTDNANYSTYGTYYFVRYAKDGTCNTEFAASDGQYTLQVTPDLPPGAEVSIRCNNIEWSSEVKLPTCNHTLPNMTNDPYCGTYTYNSILYYVYNARFVVDYQHVLCPAPWRVPSIADVEKINGCKTLSINQIWGADRPGAACRGCVAFDSKAGENKYFKLNQLNNLCIVNTNVEVSSIGVGYSASLVRCVRD
jgi:hypothetical protein